MWMVDLGGAHTGLLFAYWNMEVAHDNKKNHVPMWIQMGWGG